VGVSRPRPAAEHTTAGTTILDIDPGKDGCVACASDRATAAEAKLGAPGKAGARVRLLDTVPGLVPRQFQAGEDDRRGRITERGPAVLRKRWAPCAWAMPRYNRWARAVLDRLSRGKARRKQAVVALADADRFHAHRTAASAASTARTSQGAKQGPTYGVWKVWKMMLPSSAIMPLASSGRTTPGKGVATTFGYCAPKRPHFILAQYQHCVVFKLLITLPTRASPLGSSSPHRSRTARPVDRLRKNVMPFAARPPLSG
jgi:hypothetical protein